MIDLARKLIAEQFPQYAGLPIVDVEKQGHDNRTYRLGDDMLVRMPTAEQYAPRVSMEHHILPKLASRLSFNIPVPIKIGVPSKDYPFSFSIYQYLPGTSINLLTLSIAEVEQLALDLAKFLRELHKIVDIDRLTPDQHSDRGEHVSIYAKDAREQIAELSGLIDANQAFHLWEKACATRWNKAPVWVQGDFAIGNILMQDGK